MSCHSEKMNKKGSKFSLLGLDEGCKDYHFWFVYTPKIENSQEMPLLFLGVWDPNCINKPAESNCKLR